VLKGENLVTTLARRSSAVAAIAIAPSSLARSLLSPTPKSHTSTRNPNKAETSQLAAPIQSTPSLHLINSSSEPTFTLDERACCRFRLRLLTLAGVNLLTIESTSNLHGDMRRTCGVQATNEMFGRDVIADLRQFHR
jgi:hypothetical protein